MTSNQTSKEELLDKLIQSLGDLCHERYTGCVKERNTGITEQDFDYCYTSEVINMLDTPEAKKLLKAYTQSILQEVIGQAVKHPSWCGSSCDDISHVENGLIQAQWLRASKYGYKKPS